MDIIPGQIQSSERLAKPKENNIKYVTEEIYKQINEQLQLKLQEVCDFICLEYISIISKKKITFKIPKTDNKIIGIEDISKLQSGDLMDGSLIIKLHDDITIEYICPTSEQCIQQIISPLRKGKKKLKLKITDEDTYIICKISV